MDSTPTGSVTGQQDWQWNRLQEERRTARQSRCSRCTDPRQLTPPEAPRRPAIGEAARADRQTLVAILERKERRLQAVITRYERLLHERNRELAEATAEPTWSGRTRTLLQVLRRLIAGP